MPTLICGQDRSGTSLVARLLNLCGLYLGEEDELIPAQPHNPRGLWESAAFQLVSTTLLKIFGEGMTDHYDKSKLSYIIPTARVLARRSHIRVFWDPDRQDSPWYDWGWKDPRASMVIPFWQDIVPDLKVVQVIRRPQDCLKSWINRNEERGENIDWPEAYWHWCLYNARIRRYAKRRAVVSYEGFFGDRAYEILFLLCQWCGLKGPGHAEALRQEVDPSLRHYKQEQRDLPSEVNDLYLELLGEAL